MRVTFDPDAQAAYIYRTGAIQPGEAKRTLAVTDSIILDFDGEGHLIGVELLDPALLHPVLRAKVES